MMRMYTIVIICVLLFTQMHASSQSTLGSGKGEGSLNLDPHGHSYIQLNLAQPAFTLTYQNSIKSVFKEHWNPTYGLQFTVKPSGTTNKVNFFNDGGVNAGVKSIATLSWANIFGRRPSENEFLASDVGPDILALDNSMKLILDPIFYSSQFTKGLIVETEEVKLLKTDLPKIGLPDGTLTQLLETLTKFDELVTSKGKEIQTNLKAIDNTSNPTIIKQLRKSIGNAQAVITHSWSTVEPQLTPFSQLVQVSYGPGKLTWDTLALNAGYIHDQYKLLNTIATFSNQIRTKQFDGWIVSLDYNSQFGLKGGPVIFGLSIGGEQRNNSDELPQLQVLDQVFSSQDGTNIRIASKSRTILGGQYKESFGVKFAADLVFKPISLDRKGRFGVDVFTRSNYANHRIFNPGIAFFITPEKQPLQVNGAIALVQTAKNKWELDIISGFSF